MTNHMAKELILGPMETILGEYKMTYGRNFMAWENMRECK